MPRACVSFTHQHDEHDEQLHDLRSAYPGHTHVLSDVGSGLDFQRPGLQGQEIARPLHPKQNNVCCVCAPADPDVSDTKGLTANGGLSPFRQSVSEFPFPRQTVLMRICFVYVCV